MSFAHGYAIVCAKPTAGLSFIGAWPEPFSELAQVLSYGRDRRPKRLLPSTSLPSTRRVGQFFLANRNNSEALLVAPGWLGRRHSVRARLENSHVDIVIGCFGLSVGLLGIGVLGEGWWARDEDELEALHVVDVVRFVVLDLGAIEEVNVSALDGACVLELDDDCYMHLGIIPD